MKIFTDTSYYLPLVEKFTVNNYYLPSLHLRNIIENY